MKNWAKNLVFLFISSIDSPIKESNYCVQSAVFDFRKEILIFMPRLSIVQDEFTLTFLVSFPFVIMHLLTTQSSPLLMFCKRLLKLHESESSLARISSSSSSSASSSSSTPMTADSRTRSRRSEDDSSQRNDIFFR